ncbi:amidohydrolase [Chitinophaga rhizophila]|uniref:Amidohydrolase n=1 Tax=Chitinophaga rhizophila TaxID=2866212 RepID=A0ABS7GJH6_9BACT|nr:amidohydrolase [Chitinophaga rhizophila]MBW8687865.1 amidohydrolase [Chitinophaga rhizophila]
MKKTMRSLVALCVGITFSAQAQQRPTLIIHNANIITLDDTKPQAQAIAIADNRIIAVGNDADILKLKTSRTKVVKANGRTLIPGLYDSHLHVIRAGRFYNTELRWDGVKSLKRALQMLKEQAARTPEGQWVRVVGGWNEYQFEEKRLPTLEEINEATGNTPTFILYLYAHAYLNKAGVKKLQINEHTPNPTGGLIQKDAEGQPTGLLVAEPNAFILYSTLARLPELTPAEKGNSTLGFMSEMNRLGVTSVMDAGGGFQNFPDDYGITDSLFKLGQLTVRLPYYLFAQKAGTELQDYQKWISMVDIEHQHGEEAETTYFVEGGGENLVATGGDFENFLKPRPDLPAVMEAQLKVVISVLVKNKWPFRLHATYNESITRFLNVIEEVNKETPLNGLPWFFDHAETVSIENLQRIKALNGGIAIQHRMAFQGENFVGRYGKEAARNTPPIRRMLDMGLKVGAGTDGTRVASYNPWVALSWLVTGQTIGGHEYTADENKLDRITALKLYTQGSASLINQQGDRGTLKKGYLADLVVLSDDYLKTAAGQIKDIHALLTILDGKIVYGEGEFKDISPALPKALPEWSPVNYYGGYQYK